MNKKGILKHFAELLDFFRAEHSSLYRTNVPFLVGDGYMATRAFKIREDTATFSTYNTVSNKWGATSLNDIEYLYRALILGRGHLWVEVQKTTKG